MRSKLLWGERRQPAVGQHSGLWAVRMVVLHSNYTQILRPRTDIHNVAEGRYPPLYTPNTVLLAVHYGNDVFLYVNRVAHWALGHSPSLFCPANNTRFHLHPKIKSVQCRRFNSTRVFIVLLIHNNSPLWINRLPLYWKKSQVANL